MLLNVDSQTTLVNGLLSATICPVVDLYIFQRQQSSTAFSLIMLENYETMMRTGNICSNTKSI